MKARVPISQALADEKLLAASLGDLTTWAVWLAVLKAAFAEALTDDDLAAFKSVAGNREPPSKRVRELWAICGRRSGKSRMAAAVAVFVALLTDARAKLAPGETGFITVHAPSLPQSKLIFDYALAFIRQSPLLAAQLDGEPTANEIRLRGGIVIAVHSASYRTTRGRTLLACVFDETAYWKDELSAIPDIEVYRSVLPALATTSGMLIAVGSPHSRRGLQWQKFRDHFGQDDDAILVVRGASRQFNPTLDAGLIEQAERDDPEAAQSEWLAQFRSDIGALLDDAVIDAAVEHGRPLEMPPREGITYHAFTDASAGRHDAFTLCIGHADGDRFICDLIRGRNAPFDPASVAGEYAAVAKQYGVRRITGDNYAGEWVAQAFRDCGVTYETCGTPKSGLYLESLPWFNRAAVRIPEHAPLIRELRLLERRVHRSGKDSVDHPRAGSDDFANSLVGALHLAVRAVHQRIGVGVFNSAGGGGRVYPVESKRERVLRIVSVNEADLERGNDGLWRFREDAA